MSEFLDTLNAQRRAWDSRPALRALYRDWYGRMGSLLAPGAPTVELGGGIGTMKEVIPDVVTTDVRASPWAEAVVDATSLPYADCEVANIVAVDVLHHVPRPLAALREASRVLAPGGRVVLSEPYVSPLSYLAYRAFHDERTDLRADPFASDAHSTDDPFDANQALPTLLFFRHLARTVSAVPSLKVVRRERFGLVAYPLSGGFTGPRLLPARVLPALARAERPLESRLGPAMAFRCLVVLERARESN